MKADLLSGAPRRALPGFVLLFITGCGALVTKAPPRDHAQQASFKCTEDNVGAWLDVTMASIFVLGTGYSPDESVKPDASWVGMNLGIATLYGVSAARGFRKSKRCRAALQQLAQRRLLQPPVAPASTEVAAVVVSPPRFTIAVGSSLQLLATAHSSSGSVIPGRGFTWSSSDSTVASVNRAGWVTARAPGSVTIGATMGDFTGSATIVVALPR